MSRRLVVTYLAITAFALALVVVPFGTVFAGREEDRLLFEIERDARAVASHAEDALERGTTPDLAAVFGSYGSSGGRIVVVDRNGRDVADSSTGGATGEDFSGRPEVAAALGGMTVSGTRHSATAGTDLLYVAVPVASSGVVHGAVRVTYPSSTLDARVRANWLRLGLLSSVVLAAVAAVGFLLARTVSGPVRRVRRAAHALAEGDLTARVPEGEGPPEIRDLATTFNAMAGRLGKLIDSQRRFVSDASHQLRTPLTALRLRLETLRGTVTGPQGEDVDAAIRETARLGRLVQSLLVLARLDATAPGTEPVDVDAVVADRVETWGPVAADQDVHLVATPAASLSAVAVPGALEQILDNLVSNALDVAPPGSTVTIATTPTPTTVEVHVLDEGPGMPPEQLAHAFERFWRAPQESAEGFGLGLAIVQQLAEMSGGEAGVAPAPARSGLDAWVALPRSAVTGKSPNPALTSA